MDQDQTLRFFWEELFHDQFPFRVGAKLRTKDVDGIKHRISARLKELTTTDKDRAMMWRQLKISQQQIRERDEQLARYRAQLGEAQRWVDSLLLQMDELEQAERFRISRLLPDSVLDYIMPDISKDSLYEELVVYIRTLERRQQELGAADPQDAALVAAARDAAYSEVRVLQARLNALSAVPGRSKASPQQMGGSLSPPQLSQAASRGAADNSRGGSGDYSGSRNSYRHRNGLSFERLDTNYSISTLPEYCDRTLEGMETLL